MGMKRYSKHFPKGKGGGGPSINLSNLKIAEEENYINNMPKKGKMLYNKAKDTVIKNHIKALYRPGAEIGDGGTADALREETKTGRTVGGKSHYLKAVERLNGIKKRYNNGNLCDGDKKIAKKLIDDLEDAIKERNKK